MKEMWEMEPDARITSGCARDRVVRIYEELSGVPYKTEIDIPEEVLQAERDRYLEALRAVELENGHFISFQNELETSLIEPPRRPPRRYEYDEGSD